AALINPTAFSGLVFPLKLMAMRTLSFISEWQSTDFATLSPFEVTLLGALFCCLIYGVRVPFIRLLVLLGMLHLTLQHRRYAVILAVTAALLLAEPLAAVLKPKQPDAARPASRFPLYAAAFSLLFMTAVAGARFAVPTIVDDGYTTPVTAFDHVPATLVGQPVFN